MTGSRVYRVARQAILRARCSATHKRAALWPRNRLDGLPARAFFLFTAPGRRGAGPQARSVAERAARVASRAHRSPHLSHACAPSFGVYRVFSSGLLLKAAVVERRCRRGEVKAKSGRALERSSDDEAAQARRSGEAGSGGMTPSSLAGRGPSDVPATGIRDPHPWMPSLAACLGSGRQVLDWRGGSKRGQGELGALENGARARARRVEEARPKRGIGALNS